MLNGRDCVASVVVEFICSWWSIVKVQTIQLHYVEVVYQVVPCDSSGISENTFIIGISLSFFQLENKFVINGI